MVPPFDRPAAVEELVRLVNDADYRRNLGQEGKGYALEDFTWSAVADKYLAIYQSARIRKIEVRVIESRRAGGRGP